MMLPETSVRLFAVLVLSLPSYAVAGAFMAMPIKLFIGTHSRVEVLRITNQGDEKVTVQLDAKAWRQDATGQDVYEATKDVIFFPKIASIEKGGERIIRVGYQGQNNLTAEKTYRLFVEELPVAKPGELALKFALRLSIPVFVQPLQEKRSQWSVDTPTLSGEILGLTVINDANTHLMISSISVTGLANSGEKTFSREVAGWYVLAGARRSFAMDFPLDACRRTATVDVNVKVNGDNRKSTLDVEKRMCTPSKRRDSKDAEGDVRQ
jgi:fimbrial chaperone protein